jgi:hypothetical protein
METLQTHYRRMSNENEDRMFDAFTTSKAPRRYQITILLLLCVF